MTPRTAAGGLTVLPIVADDLTSGQGDKTLVFSIGKSFQLN